MQLVIEKSALLKALGHVASIVERRHTIPILSNVLIQVDGNVMQLTATDLEREVVERVPAEVKQSGGTTVSAHMLHDIVRKLPDGAQINFNLNPETNQLILSAGQGRYELQALPASDFPELSTDDLTHNFDLLAADAKNLINKTSFAMGTEETRFYLMGIYLHSSEGDDGKANLRAVSTDGHRLALIDLPLPGGAEGMPGVIIPRKTVLELHRLVADQTDPIQVSLSDSKIRFSFGDLILTSKLIDGTFPDYSRVIPKNNDKELTVSSSVFSDAVDRVSTLSSDRGRAVKLQLAPSNLTLSVNNPDSGSATEKLAVDYGAGEMEIGFNARYLLDITKQLESEKAQFLLSDAGSPTMVRDEGTSKALYVLMPMRV